MRLKLDENVTVQAAPGLRSLGHDVDTVLDEALGGRCDDDVGQAAQQASRFFVAQDLDFADVRRFAPGTHHGVLLVRIPDGEQSRLAAYLEAWLQTPESEGWARCFVVATPNKVGVLRPEATTPA